MTICRPKLIAKPGDINKEYITTLKMMHLCCFGKCPEPDYEDNHWWLVYDDEYPIAFSGIDIVDNQAVFVRAGVLPDWRGNKLQIKMAKSRIAYAKRKKCICCKTYTMNNPASEKSLVAVGFEKYNPKVKWVGEATYWKLKIV